VNRLTLDGQNSVQVMGFTAYDVQELAYEAGYEISREEANAFLAQHSIKFRNKMVEFGNELLEQMMFGGKPNDLTAAKQAANM